MLTNSWIYDGMIYIYTLSLLFFFSDISGKNQRNKQIGAGLLLLVWILQILFFIGRMVAADYIPLFTLFESLFLFSWIMVSFSLVVHYFLKFDVLVFMVSCTSFIILLLSIFVSHSESSFQMIGDALGNLFIIHSSLAIASYALFSISAILSGLYLFLHSQLKGKQFSIIVKRLPGLDKIELYLFRLVIMGSTTLFISTMIAVVWIIWMDKIQWLFDPMIFNMFLILAAYGFYFSQRGSNCTGSRLSVYNLLAFSVVIIHFMMIQLISDFHPLAGRQIGAKLLFIDD